MSAPPPFLARLKRINARLRFGGVLALALLLAIIGEQFPFSNFPMYSNFEPDAQVLYLADRAGNPLPSKLHFRISTSKIKKSYKSELKEICELASVKPREASDEQQSAAAREVLLRVADRRASKKAPPLPDDMAELVLVQHKLMLVDDEFVESKRPLGAIPFSRERQR